MTRAQGQFDVNVTPMAPEEVDPGFARLALEKRFHGDLAGESRGIMLAVGGPETGAGGYIALERVTGTLHGRRGTFVMQQRGSMSPGQMEMDVRVVPGSGTDALLGIAGNMTIRISNGEHSYEFDYTLPGGG